MRFSTSKWFWPLLSFLCIAHIGLSQNDTSEQQNRKKYPSKLWRITGNGSSGTSYLYGTMHVSKKVAFHLSDSVFIGIKECDVVALETNPQNWLPDMMNSDLMRDADNMRSRFRRDGGSGFYKEAFELADVDNEDLSEALRDEHSMVNPMLYRESGYNQDFEEKTYLDMFIYQAGAKQGKIIENLEDFEESTRQSYEAQIPDPDEEEQGRKSRYYSDGRTIWEVIEDAYRKGDLDLLDSLQRYSSPSKKYYQVFIVDRNRQMVESMDSIIQSGKTVFSAIGAAHLAGSQGAIEMLRDMGYTVQPVQAEITKKGRKMWNDLKKTFIPLEYNTNYTAKDNMFTLLTPGQMYETGDGSYSKDYIFPEMTNGAYYSVNRMSHFGILHGQSDDDLMLKMDSLFFENIPGDILRKERIAQFGYPGFDIENVTSTGDHQRYQIYFTPLEIVMVKMGGTGKFAKKKKLFGKKESDKFFSTFQLKSSSGQWKNQTFEGGKFSVDLPLFYTHNGKATSKTSFSSRHEVIQGYDQSNGAYFLVMQKHLSDFDMFEDDSFELQQLLKKFGDNLDYEVTSLSLATINGYPGATATYKHEEHGMMEAQVVLKETAFTLLAAKGHNEKQSAKFFGSFKFVPHSYQAEPIFEQKDTFGHFVVTTTELPDVIFKRIRDNRYSRYGDKEDDDSYLSKSDYNRFSYDKTGEYLPAYFNRYHKYASGDSLSGYWNYFEKRMLGSDDKGLYYKKFDTSYEDGIHKLHFVVGDTFSIRTMHGKIMLKQGAFYSTYMLTDSLSGPSKFQQTVFDSYRPSDTVIGRPYFEHKTNLFFEDLWSGDSTRRAQALRSINTVHFGDDDATIDSIIRVIDHFVFDEEEDEMEYKLEFIDRLGWRENERIPSYLATLFERSEDEYSVQFKALEALAQQRTIEANKTFADIIVEEPPLSDGSEIGKIFGYLNDSLEIAHHLYPKILSLTEFEEYEDEVYELLAMLVDSNMVETEVYAGEYQRKILREAKNEIKRKRSAEDADGGSSSSSRYSSYASSSRDDLEIYASLLLPFYSDEKQVREVLDDYWKIEDKSHRTAATLLFIEREVAVPDTIIEDLASDYKYVGQLYDGLDELDKTSLIPAEHLKQAQFAKGALFYSYDTEDEDSFELMETRTFTLNDTQAVMYVFKSKKEYSSDWGINFVVYETADTNQVTTDYYYGTSFSVDVDNAKLVNKKLEEFIEWLPIKDRPRVAKPSTSSRSSYLRF